MTIDAVITWVDGNDPVLTSKRQQYGTKQQFSQVDIAGTTRYANVGEIFWCVASINRFAPWIRKIFIITDGQNPHLEPLLEKHFPAGFIPIEIVDHKVIFEGYEQYLPTFNSISIETMMWRIPDLSEKFIYLNDDFMLISPVEPSDFFQEDKVIAHITPRLMFGTWLQHFLRPKDKGRERMSFKWTMYLAAKLHGVRRYYRLYHTPHGLLKSTFAQCYEEHPDWLLLNIAHRFRDITQYSVVELVYIALLKQNRLTILNPHKNYMYYLEPKNKYKYVARKMSKLMKGQYTCCCFNSLDQASAEDKKLIVDWIESRLGLLK